MAVAARAPAAADSSAAASPDLLAGLDQLTALAAEEGTPTPPVSSARIFAMHLARF